MRSTARRGWPGVALWALLGPACTTGGPAPPPGPSTPTPSPNASILPAPLTSARRLDAGAEAAPTDASADADAHLHADADAAPPPAPPRVLREDGPVDPDRVNARDLHPALELRARFSWPEITPAAPGEADARAYARLLELAERRVTITLASVGRLRLVIASPTFAVERGVEIRARSDLLGHVMVWPDQHSYRVLQPGTLRAFLNEGRADVLALDSPSVAGRQSGTALGFDTTTVALTTDLGRLALTQAIIPEAAAAGALLCRLLIELACIEPTAAACDSGLVPIRAEYTWADGGRLVFEVTSLTRVAEPDTDSLRAPPAAPHFKGDLLPTAASGPLADPGELRALRRRDAPVDPADAGAPEAGLRLANEADVPAYALLDGVPVARLAPHRTLTLPSLRPGTYAVRWSDFLGSIPAAAESITVPGAAVHGIAPDAGAPTPK